MTVLMYQHRFAEPIRKGIKRQTIRPERKRPIMIGEIISHRMWEGKAYRSRQVEIASGNCTGVFPIGIDDRGVVIGLSSGAAKMTTPAELDEFAIGDGFESWADMLAYFNEPGAYGLPFSGILIQWE